jgi:RNA polymerase sigma-70 factor, ECF subfamily
VAAVVRLSGDLQLAEDAAQEACAVALATWPVQGVPRRPTAWLIGTARHKAIDIMRRDRRRADKEMLAALEADVASPAGGAEPGVRPDPFDDDQLGLMFLCCHPALELEARIALTLRSVGGVPTDEIARLFLLPTATLAQRLVRAKRKIAAAKIRFRSPDTIDQHDRLPNVLQVIWLIFTSGHRQPGNGDPACAQAIRLARTLHRSLPSDPEVTGLLALLLLVDGRRPGRIDTTGLVVALPDQDRTLWNTHHIEEGQRLLDHAAQQRRPGPYQIQAAIAVLHSTATSEDHTDWHQIAALYQELTRYVPTPVVQANRAVAVAMAHGPDAGLAILDTLTTDPRMDHWPGLHIARAALLARLSRRNQAIDAYQTALDLQPPTPEAAFITARIHELRS